MCSPSVKTLAFTGELRYPGRGGESRPNKKAGDPYAGCNFDLGPRRRLVLLVFPSHPPSPAEQLRSRARPPHLDVLMRNPGLALMVVAAALLLGGFVSPWLFFVVLLFAFCV